MQLIRAGIDLMNTAYNYLDLTPNGGVKVVADNSESGATTSTRIEDGERNPQIIPGQKSASRKSTQKSARRRLTDSKPMVMSIARVAE